MKQHHTPGVCPSPELASVCRKLVLQQGIVPVAHRLGLGRETVTRLAAGLPCQRGTIVIAELALGLGNG